MMSEKVKSSSRDPYSVPALEYGNSARLQVGFQEGHLPERTSKTHFMCAFSFHSSLMSPSRLLWRIYLFFGFESLKVYTLAIEHLKIHTNNYHSCPVTTDFTPALNYRIMQMIANLVLFRMCWRRGISILAR